MLSMRLYLLVSANFSTHTIACHIFYRRTKSLSGRPAALRLPLRCRVQYPCPSDHGIGQCYTLKHTFQI